jgi:ABC-type antimicrobial peptide transport system permease subunit
MEQLAKSSLARQRFLMLLFGAFAGIALLLACVGVYGVLSYLTQQRIPEIGLRMALGASAGGIEWLFLRESLARVAIGIGIGLLCSIAAAQVLQSSVAGMQKADAATFGITVLVLLAAALVASFLPARRASQVDPMVALRAE